MCQLRVGAWTCTFNYVIDSRQKMGVINTYSSTLVDTLKEISRYNQDSSISCLWKNFTIVLQNLNILNIYFSLKILSCYRACFNANKKILQYGSQSWQMRRLPIWGLKGEGVISKLLCSADLPIVFNP